MSERQEIFKSTIKDKLKLQSRATERYHDQIFEEMEELCHLCRSKKAAEEGVGLAASFLF